MNANGKRARKQSGLSRGALHKATHTPKRKDKVFEQHKKRTGEQMLAEQEAWLASRRK
ncbi:MAG: hypothetical protein WC373_04710 [Smithella sp.]